MSPVAAIQVTWRNCRYMSITMRRAPLYALLTWLAFCGPASAEKVTVRGPRPVADAVRKLEKRYGWPITYEDPPWVYKGDTKVVTPRTPKDGKRAGEGAPRIAPPRGGAFTFVMGDADLTFIMGDVARPWRGRRSFEPVARDAILAMLKSYSRSIGGAEIFALTESDDMFHVVPVQRRDASGKMERIVPLLDTPVSIPGKPNTLSALLNAIFRSLTESTGTRVGVPMAPPHTPIYISAEPGESARSVLSRAIAEQKRLGPLSWALFYTSNWGYMLNFHTVDTSSR
jgi:hypothetical protein